MPHPNVQAESCERVLNQAYEAMQQQQNPYLTLLAVPYLPNAVNPTLPWIALPMRNRLLPEMVTRQEGIEHFKPAIAATIGELIGQTLQMRDSIVAIAGLPGSKPIVRAAESRGMAPCSTRIYAPFAVELRPPRAYPKTFEWHPCNILAAHFSAYSTPRIIEVHEANYARRRACSVLALRRLESLLSLAKIS